MLLYHRLAPAQRILLAVHRRECQTCRKKLFIAHVCSSEDKMRLRAKKQQEERFEAGAAAGRISQSSTGAAAGRISRSSTCTAQTSVPRAKYLRGCKPSNTSASNETVPHRRRQKIQNASNTARWREQALHAVDEVATLWYRCASHCSIWVGQVSVREQLLECSILVAPKPRVRRHAQCGRKI